MYNASMGEKPLEQLVGELLTAQGLTLGVAESFTGGLIGHTITNVPGSSDYFLGGVVSYASLVKELVLGVSHETIMTSGAVSNETVVEMAQGVRELLGADIGISVSGIAGPGGGTPETPVGTAWIGLSSATKILAWRYLFKGERSQVKVQAAQQALQNLVNYLSDLR